LLAHFEFSASSPRSAMRRAIRAGAAKPDISSVEAFRRTLLAAKSIVYTDPAILGPSTMNFQKVLDRLGIAKEMKAKSLLNARAATTPNAEIVARGEAELGIQLISEIVSVPGAELLGALPAELQIMNVDWAGIVTTASEPDAAKVLFKFLSSPARFANARYRSRQLPSAE
jgi:molybdate transport system substrate-binding protein